MVNGWALAKVALVITSSVATFQMQKDQFAAMQQAGAMPGPAGMASFMNIALVAGVALALIWGCALPVFMLIWFRRARIRAELASWR